MEGNQQKMREALIEIEKMAHCDLGNVYPKYRNKFDNLVGGIERIARAALSAPAPTTEKSSAVGNAAAMREALEMARDALKSAEKYVYGDPPNGGAIGWDDVWPSEWHNALEAVERALSAPARNCDVGTADEQHKRFMLFCHSKRGCLYCEFSNKLSATQCGVHWAQMPYEEEGGAE